MGILSRLVVLTRVVLLRLGHWVAFGFTIGRLGYCSGIRDGDSMIGLLT